MRNKERTLSLFFLKF